VKKRYFEDCRVGDSLLTPGRTITETDIVNFAAFTGDWNRIHTDAEYAKANVFGERIAHGLLTVTVGMPLLFRPNAHALLPESLIAIVGMDRIRFVEPVKIGDTIHVEGEVVATTRMPRQPRGLIEVKLRVRNQANATVVTGRLKALVGCRPPSEAPGPGA
jgi:3-hydroxybutyryl-CoA dehydratase